MEIVSHVNTSFVNKTIDLGIDTHVNILKDLLIFNYVSLQLVKIIFIDLDIVHHNFNHTRINYVSSIKKKKIVWLANTSIKRRLVTVFPKHVYHFSNLSIENYSFQRKWVDIFCRQNVDVKNKAPIKQIFFFYSVLRYICHKIS